MNISGISLIPAAIPTPAPFHHRLALVSGWVRSHRISAIRARLTCREPGSYREGYSVVQCGRRNMRPSRSCSESPISSRALTR